MVLCVAQGRRKMNGLVRRGVGGPYVPREPNKPNDGAASVEQRLLPRQAPAFFAARVEVKLKLSFERPGAFEDGEVLRGDAPAEFARKDLIGSQADQGLLALMACTLRQNLVRPRHSGRPRP